MFCGDAASFRDVFHPRPQGEAVANDSPVDCQSRRTDRAGLCPWRDHHSPEANIAHEVRFTFHAVEYIVQKSLFCFRKRGIFVVRVFIRDLGHDLVHQIEAQRSGFDLERRSPANLRGMALAPFRAIRGDFDVVRVFIRDLGSTSFTKSKPSGAGSIWKGETPRIFEEWRLRHFELFAGISTWCG